jgi:CDP-glycerol glycerophosphotransferase (TagB/SpsB family)
MDEPDRPSLLRRVARRFVVRREPPGPAAYPPLAVEVESHLVGVRWPDDHTLQLRGWVYRPGFPVTEEHAPGLGVRLEDPERETVAEALVSPYAEPAVNVEADDARHDYTWAAFEAELDVRPLRARGGGPWTVVFRLDRDDETEDGPLVGPFVSRDLHASAGSLPSGGAVDGIDLRLDWTEGNGLVIHHEDEVTEQSDVTAPVLAESVTADPDAGTLVVTGTTAASSLALELRGQRRTVSAGPVTAESGRFEVTVPLLAPDWYGDERPLLSGLYFLHAVLDDGTSVEVAMTPGCVTEVGALQQGERFHVRVERTRSDAVRLRIDPPLRDDERGAFAQMQLRRDYRAMPPVTERGDLSPSTLLYECYYGVSCTDSARAIHDELVRRRAPARHVWGVADLSVPVPAGAEAVLRHSREWWQALGSATHLTFNAGLPAGLVRRPGQVLVQTWHGTPLKLLGHDRPVNHDKPGFEESTRRYVSRWDHLLAGNPHSAEAFRSAWFYDGSVLEVGYPRNDALAAPDPAYVQGVRERLGIGPEQRVVLYAPTWRDGSRVMPELLDLDRLAELLPDHVLLVRGHMNITRWKHRPEGDALLDVTTYPEINDLFLVADVAVTDYSSIMFDYSVTRKPMVFFVPDLEDYRDRRRGVYFDLGETAPGPLLTTTEEVAEVLRDLDPAAYEAAYGERYDAWVARFNPHDDGHAAARVVDRLYDLG